MNQTESQRPIFNLADMSLFGAEAAEREEDQEVFNSYFYQTSQFQDFADPSRSYQIANAYKGEGKSSFLRAVEKRVSDRDLGFVARISSADLEVPDHGENIDAWMRTWKQALVKLIAIEIGKSIQMAWSDDDIKAVEEAERQGYKEKNMIGLVLDRFSLKVTGGGAEIEYKSSPSQVTEITIQRLLSKKVVWILVDESDVNFINTKSGRSKVAGLLTACRKLCQTTPNLRIRTTLRPTTWSALYKNVEDMTHVRDCLLPLQWQTQDIRNILSKRIESYLIRTGQSRFTVGLDGRRIREEDLIQLLFPGAWQWAKTTTTNKGERPPFVVLSNLCRDRPRWLIELCQESAKRARNRESETISKSDVVDSLVEFGRRRLQDLHGEFLAECEQIEQIVNGFQGQNESYKTDELLKLIKNRITDHVNVKISYENGRCQPLQVAHFLFKMGFLTARKDLDAEQYKHYSYSENPSLLQDKANPDQGCSWEIHPVYRQALGIRDRSGHEVLWTSNRSGKERR